MWPCFRGRVIQQWSWKRLDLNTVAIFQDILLSTIMSEVDWSIWMYLRRAILLTKGYTFTALASEGAFLSMVQDTLHMYFAKLLVQPVLALTDTVKRLALERDADVRAGGH